MRRVGTSGSVSLDRIVVDFAVGPYAVNEGLPVDVGVLLNTAHTVAEGVELPLVVGSERGLQGYVWAGGCRNRADPIGRRLSA